jgi:hypothetical protein
VYSALDVLRRHNARIVSLVGGQNTQERSELIVRIQDVTDREKLREDLEEALRAAR